MSKFLIAILVIGGLYIGYAKYTENKFKEIFRSEIKAIQLPEEQKQALQKNVPFIVDVQNNYPEIIHITKFAKDVNIPAEKALYAKMEAHDKRCGFLKNPKLKNDEDYRKGALAVIEEDNIIVTQILKHGNKEVFKISQPLKECTEFSKLKNPEFWDSE